MASVLHRVSLVASFLVVSPALAATLVEFREDESSSRIWVEGSLARIHDDKNKDGYMLLDLKTNQFLLVDKGFKTAVPLDLGGEKEKVQFTADLALKDEGAGPTIAGYPTRHYSLTADGETCGEYYFSKETVNDANVRALLEYLRKRVVGAGDSEEPCEQAESYIVHQYEKLGLSMRELDMNGELVQETVRIEKNAPLPAGGLALPAGYRRVTMEQYVQQKMQQQKR